MLRPLVLAFQAFALALLVFQQPAQAYIDPATGSLIIQGLVAFFVGAAFTLKNFWHTKVKGFINFVLRRPAPKADAGEPEPPKA